MQQRILKKEARVLFFHVQLILLILLHNLVSKVCNLKAMSV